MMREFNTTGPCDPALHYTVMREALMAVCIEKVKKGRYITLFAPRQSGKTTFFKLLLNALEKDFTAVWISFENLTSASKEEFYQGVNYKLHWELAKHGIQPELIIRNAVSLEYFFKNTSAQSKPLVLVIDEFEGIPDCVLSEVMHAFRQIYHKKEDHCLHSLILVGVSTIAELVVSSASPFNIAEELQIPYFTFAEVRALINQHVAESGQIFEDDATAAVYKNTQGQPGLACALCSYIVEKLAADRCLPVTLEHYYKAQHHFLTERFDKNIINIVQKARKKRNFMLKLLFEEEPLPFSIHDPDIAWLYANGVIDEDNGETDIRVPLYKKALITAFRPLINGETQYYIR
ncbi:MAG: ATP-binding protein, partial [Gammaproteobacteria bacterium]|nr:ATP-binding protein [Gammaproteobacteria bacterium]